MKEILPGVHHWTAMHPKIKFMVSSYYLSASRVLIDPLTPDEGLDVFADNPPEHALLTNRHHYRSCGELAERFGCKVHAPRPGMHEFTHGEVVEPYDYGDGLPGDIRALEIGVLCPDEAALLIPGGILAVADGVIRYEDGPLTFVPDPYLGDDPGAIKQGLKQAYGRLLEHEFDHLLLAHGQPWIGGARQALRDWVES